MPEKLTPELLQHMETLVKNLLSGESEDIEVTIKLKLPKSLYDTYNTVSKHYGIPIETTLSNAASEGLHNALKDSMKLNPKTEKVKEEIGLEAAGLDLSGITGALQSLQTLTKSLEGLQGQLDATEDKQNSK